jgi:hypothetical protein
MHRYLSAVGLGDLARYREPESGAAVGAGEGGPVEALEDEGQLVLRDAGPVSETSSSARPSSSRTTTATLPPSGVYLTALSRSMEATWRTRPRSKVAGTSRSGPAHSTETFPQAALAACAASRATAARSWRPTLRSLCCADPGDSPA